MQLDQQLRTMLAEARDLAVRCEQLGRFIDSATDEHREVVLGALEMSDPEGAQRLRMLYARR